MVQVVGVKFKKGGKVYYFDPEELQIESGTEVLVETERGIEFGTVTMENKEVEESSLVSPLKRVIRVATAEDKLQNQNNRDKEKEAMEICQTKVAAHNLEMNLVDVEYTFDKTKLLFYFTADGRVDFRELVKDLAAVFKTRIELRQIRIRHEAKIMPGNLRFKKQGYYK